jgi:hypothetical protein
LAPPAAIPSQATPVAGSPGGGDVKNVVLIIIDSFSPANSDIIKVEPRGFEPLISAVERRVQLFTGVRCSSKESIWKTY